MPDTKPEKFVQLIPLSEKLVAALTNDGRIFTASFLDSSAVAWTGYQLPDFERWPAREPLPHPEVAASEESRLCVTCGNTVNESQWVSVRAGTPAVRHATCGTPEEWMP